jgi:hypothetical protein
MPEALPMHHKSYALAGSCLRACRNKDAAVSRLVEQEKLPMGEANALIDHIYAKNIRRNKTYGLKYMIGSAVVFVIFLWIFLQTGRLFFVILPMSLWSFFKGVTWLVSSDGFA